MIYFDGMCYRLVLQIVDAHHFSKSEVCTSFVSAVEHVFGRSDWHILHRLVDYNCIDLVIIVFKVYFSWYVFFGNTGASRHFVVVVIGNCTVVELGIDNRAGFRCSEVYVRGVFALVFFAAFGFNLRHIFGFAEL